MTAALSEPRLMVPAPVDSSSSSGAGGSGAASGPQQPRAGAPAAAPAARRRATLTLTEMRSKAAFRACLRLMDRSVDSEEQLWMVARVMSGEEYAQAAEERSLAGKCGNPLCSHAPAGALQAAPSSSSGSSGRRYHISAREQAVYELPGAADQPLYCGGGCETAVAAFAARLGSGALALERFTALYRQLKAREGAATSAAAATAQAQTQEPLQLTDAAEAPAAAQPASAESSKAASSSSSGAAGGIGSDPGSIGSAQSLVPRLAVEQVPVKLIDSSAGQFGDFSYKPKPRAAAAAAGAQGAAPVKGVLKKRSQFAAGSTKVPIMLAEVKERDLNQVEAETARSMPPEGPDTAAATARRSSSKAAAAVEGYVPRAVKSSKRKEGRERRVRWSDELEEDGEEGEGQKGQTKQHPKEQWQKQPEQLQQQQHAAAAARAAPLPAGVAAPAPQFAAAASASSSSGIATAAAQAAAPTAAVLVFDLEDPAGPLEAAGPAALTAQMGRLRVAEPSELPPAAAAAAAAVSVAATAGPAAAAAPRSARPGRSSPFLVPVRSLSPVPAHSPSRSPVSSSIDILRRGSGSGSGEFGSVVVPPEWRDAPQFYAHSPMGSSSSLAGSLASPMGSSGNLAAIAVASSPPARGVQLRVSSPPGLPRAPSSSLRSSGGSSSRLAAPQPAPPLRESNGEVTATMVGSSEAHAAAAQRLDQQQQQGQQQQQQQQQGEQEEPFLTRRQAAQLQQAFPPLAGVLPPELQAVLGSDSETEGSEAAESEDWMHSDADLEAASSSDDETGEGARSAYRVQMSFFGTLFTHLEAWVTPSTVELLAAGPSVEVALPPPTSPEVEATLGRVLAQALPPVLVGLQAGAPRSDVERSLHELLRTLRLVGPLPPFRTAQWQVVALLLLKALSLERCPGLREAFESREGIARVGRLLASLAFTSEEFYAVLELLCPVE